MTAEAALPLPKYTYTINVHAAYIHAIAREQAYGGTLFLRHPDHGDLIEQPVSQRYLQKFNPMLAGYFTWDPEMEEEGYMDGDEFEKRFNREDTVSDLPIATESD